MNNLYLSRDLSESSALIVSGQHLLRIERRGKICWFAFANYQKCKEISDEYFFGELMVNAREFHDAMTRLKNRIFAEVKTPTEK